VAEQRAHTSICSGVLLPFSHAGVQRRRASRSAKPLATPPFGCRSGRPELVEGRKTRGRLPTAAGRSGRALSVRCRERRLCSGRTSLDPNGAQPRWFPEPPRIFTPDACRHGSRLRCARRPPPLACPRLAAVRSPTCHGEAGNRPERFCAASSVCAIRDVRGSPAGVCRAGRRSKWVLLAAGATGFERRSISRRAEPDAGRGPGSGGSLAPST
jgi:hypothetical protein